MKYWLLLLRAGEGFALSLEKIEVALGSSSRKYRIAMVPDKNKDLKLSAEHGTKLAHRILWREGLSCQALRLEFAVGNLDQTVSGRSADLLFALAVVAAVLHKTTYPCFAATGTLDESGNVLRVDGIKPKLHAAIEALPKNSIVFYPHANMADIDAIVVAQAHDKSIELCAISRLEEGIRLLGIKIRDTWLESPYRGLEAFELKHRGIFYGRKVEIEELQQRLLVREQAGRPGALILAASGTGKSSFILAGLLPQLIDSLGDRQLDWQIWRPRQAVVGDKVDLCTSIQANWGELPALNCLKAFPATNLEFLANTIPEKIHGRRFLWIIDQFEDLFTLGFDIDAVNSFAKFIHQLQVHGVWVIATLRNDYYPSYQKHESLVRAFTGDGIYDLPQIDRESLEQIIEEPAALFDISFEKNSAGNSLATRIREDMDGATTALPLLEFTLNELYLRRDTSVYPHKLTYAAYEFIGGLNGSIGETAKRVYDNEDENTKAALPRLLRALIYIDKSEEGEREMTRAVDLVAWPVNTPGRRLIESLTAARLLLIERDKSGCNLVRIAHDALLSHWTLARQLILALRNDIKLRDRLVQAKNLWEESGRASGRLLTPGLPTSAPVREAQELQKRLGDELSSDAGLIEFIRASSTHQQRFIGLIALLTLAMVSFLGVITWQLEETKQQRDLTEKAFADARATVDSFISDISKDNLAHIPGLQETRKDFAVRAITKYMHFSKERPADIAVRTGLAKARSAFGDIIGSIGSIDVAEKEIKSAIALHKINIHHQPDEWRHHLDLATAEIDLSRLYWLMGNHSEAFSYIRHALTILENLPSWVQGVDKVLFALARGYNIFGNLIRDTIGYNGEPTEFMRSLKYADMISNDFTDKLDLYALQSAVRHNISLIYSNKRELDKSLLWSDDSDKYLKKAFILAPESPMLLSQHAVALGERAITLKRLGRVDVARATFIQARDLAGAIAKNNPKVSELVWQYAHILREYATFLSERQEFEVASAHFAEGIELLENLTHRVDDRPKYGEALIYAKASLAAFQGGGKGDVPRNDEEYKQALDKVIETAERIARQHPGNPDVLASLSQAIYNRGTFEQTAERDEAALSYFVKAIDTFALAAPRVGKSNSHVYGAAVSNHRSHLMELAILARKHNRLELIHNALKTTNQFSVNYSNDGYEGIRSYAGTYNIYATMLEKSGHIDDAIVARNTAIQLAEPAWHAAEWNWWLRQTIGGTHMHLARLYQLKDDRNKETLARQEYLRIWVGPMHGVQTHFYLSLMPTTITEAQLTELREVTEKDYGMKRFTVPAIFAGVQYPFHIYITNVPYPKDPLDDQARWLKEVRGGEIPEDIRESFRKLQKDAHENNVPFTEFLLHNSERVILHKGT